MFFRALAEMGIFGFAAYCYLFVVLVPSVKNKLKLKEASSPGTHMLSTALALCLLIYLVHHFVDVSLWHHAGIQLGINLGLLNAIR